MSRHLLRRITAGPAWLLLALLMALPAAAGTEATPAQLEALKREIGQIDRWLRKAEQDRSALERELVNTEQAINRLIRERRELQAKAREQTRELAALKEREGELTARLDRQRDSLRQQIRQAWMAGDTPAVKVLLNEVDPQRVARTMTYYEYLSKDAVARLDAFNATLEELRQTRQQALASQTRLKGLEQEVSSRQDELQQRRQQRRQTLAALEAEIDDRQSERARLTADRERLEKLLREVQEAIASIPSPNESKPFKALRAKLPWPAHGKVARRYGESLAQGKLRHNGLLIATRDESEVRAVHYGRVVFANWLRGFGLMTIIDHGDGYMSLYGNNSSLLASPGDWVAAGETIALAGESGGGDETGVYFEIRHRGKPQNPQSWLARQ